MDILRKELNEIYESQNLNAENLPDEEMEAAQDLALKLVRVSNGCGVITDASCDHCYIFSGDFGKVMGLAEKTPYTSEADSSDEDIIYERIHPEDLVDKRILEYEFFKWINSKDNSTKMGNIAKCCIRMKDRYDKYRLIDNTTQIVQLTSAGKIWLILCTYNFSIKPTTQTGIDPVIVNTLDGEIKTLSFSKKRDRMLTPREKEILNLIKEGRQSKQVADILGISVHTVNRHRQNIIEKLSVCNIIEAITAANLMRLL